MQSKFRQPYSKRIATFLTRFQWALLILAAPFLLFPSPRRSLALLVVPVLWGIAWLATRKPLLNTPLNLPLFLMMLMVLVSLYATYDIAFSLPKIAGMVLGVGMYYALVHSARAEKSVWVGLLVFLAAGLGIAGAGLLGTQWFDKFAFLQPLATRIPFLIQGLPGAESGFHPNEVAGALLWVLPLLVILVGWVFARLKRWAAQVGWGMSTAGAFLLLALTVFTAGEFVLTQSRGGLIGLAGTLLLLLAMLFPPKERWIYIISLVIVGVGLGVAAWRLGWVEKLYAVTPAGDNPALSLNTLKGRVEVWSRAIYGIQDFPFTGMGMNTFRKVVHVLYPLFTIGPEVDFGHAHNEFLQAALDLGLPGLIAFLALYLVAFWMLVQTWKWAKEPAQLSDSRSISSILASSRGVKALALGLGGGLMAHAFYGLTDAVALGAKPGVLFWMLLGLVAGLYQEQRKLREQDIT
ncbi:MAG: O-antigen ligase family protein [Planctomycetes bacterium]|nr:O-antigen ligase family protein [Planctomycetota bacterium]